MRFRMNIGSAFPERRGSRNAAVNHARIWQKTNTAWLVSIESTWSDWDLWVPSPWFTRRIIRVSPVFESLDPTRFSSWTPYPSPWFHFTAFKPHSGAWIMHKYELSPSFIPHPITMWPALERDILEVLKNISCFPGSICWTISSELFISSSVRIPTYLGKLQNFLIAYFLYRTFAVKIATTTKWTATILKMGRRISLSKTRRIPCNHSLLFLHRSLCQQSSLRDFIWLPWRVVKHR